MDVEPTHPGRRASTLIAMGMVTGEFDVAGIDEKIIAFVLQITT